jgi:hypothetical protein
MCSMYELLVLRYICYVLAHVFHMCSAVSVVFSCPHVLVFFVLPMCPFPCVLSLIFLFIK